MISFRVISIGTLSSHPLWDEPRDARTGHATTTLISSDDTHILVDPSLPTQALLARMSERTNVKPEDITHVFLTSLDADRRRVLGAFQDATWLAHEPERTALLKHLEDQAEEAEEADDDQLVEYFEQQAALVSRIQDAEDTITPGVDLFPLPGQTPGTCGLLIALPSQTIVITGDAIATSEHLERAQVLANAANIEQAQESFKEAIEIADVIIPGRDNIILNPVRMM